MDNNEAGLFKIMLNRYRSGIATREEISFLEAWFDLADSEDDFITAENEAGFDSLKAAMKDRIDMKIANADNLQPALYRRIPVRRWVAAAAMIVLVGAGTLFLARKSFHQPAQQRLASRNNRVPTLRLANGTVITLDSTAAGKIASQNGVIISKEKDGTLVYSSAPTEKSNADQENVLSTPAGMKFKIILPDGSRVWLNAVSTLKYPAAFGNAGRVVELEGEAYFDVAQDPDRPFIVKSGARSVHVLGTIFNINAYPEEGVSKTTLIQGSVKVVYNSGSVVVHPGQQAICDPNSNNYLHTVNADTEKETAWINNMFSFKNDSLQSVLRDVARWYNVVIKYSGHIPDERFSGEISRNSQLKDVLKILEINGVTFEIKENVITVINKN